MTSSSHAVTLGWSGTDQEADLDLRHNALGQGGAAVAGVRPHLDRRPGVEGRVAQRVGVAEQRLDAEHVLAGGGLRSAGTYAAECVADILDGCGTQAPFGELGQEAAGGHRRNLPCSSQNPRSLNPSGAGPQADVEIGHMARGDKTASSVAISA
jgi:hypothetical protein